MSRRVRSVAVAVLGGVIMTVTLLSPAEVVTAWACAEAPVIVLPSGGDVPTNAVVHVRFPADSVTLNKLGPNSQILKTASVRFADAQVRVVGPGGMVEAMQTTVVAGSLLPSLRLSFPKPLRASSAYDVVVQIAGDDYPIGSFVTGTAPDTEAPTLEAIASARFFRIKNPGHKGTSGPYVRVRVKGVAGAPMAYEIHELVADKPPSETLRAIVASAGPSFEFGRRDVCAPTDFVFADKGKLKLGIRPIDGAGNAGPMLDKTIDLGRPEIVDSGK